MLMHMLNPRDTKLSLKMTKKTQKTQPCHVQKSEVLFLRLDKLCKVLCKKLTNSSNPALADGIYLVTTLLMHMVESQGHAIVDTSRKTVWDLLKIFCLWSTNSLLVDGF